MGAPTILGGPPRAREDRVLRMVLIAVAVLGCLGFALLLIAMLWASV